MDAPTSDFVQVGRLEDLKAKGGLGANREGRVERLERYCGDHSEARHRRNRPCTVRGAIQRSGKRMMHRDRTTAGKNTS